MRWERTLWGIGIVGANKYRKLLISLSFNCKRTLKCFTAHIRFASLLHFCHPTQDAFHTNLPLAPLLSWVGMGVGFVSMASQTFMLFQG